MPSPKDAARVSTTRILSQQEMILDAVLGPEKKEKKDKKTTKIDAPEPFEKERRLTEQGSHIDSEQPLNILKDESKYNSSKSSFDKETQEKSDVVSEEQF